MIIRKAAEADIPQIMNLGREIYSQSQFKSTPYSEDKARAMLNIMMAHGLTIVTVSDMVIVGMLGAGIDTFYFSDEPVAIDYMVYVVPEFRGTRAAERMLRVYIEWAKAMHVKPENILLGLTFGVRDEVVRRFYERIGFKKLGTVLHYNEKEGV